MRARFRLLAGEALRDPFRRLRSRGCSLRPALARPSERSLLRDRRSRGFASPESSDDEYSLDEEEEEEEEDEEEHEGCTSCDATAGARGGRVARWRRGGGGVAAAWRWRGGGGMVAGVVVGTHLPRRDEPKAWRPEAKRRP